jgi:hypothetical protein
MLKDKKSVKNRVRLPFKNSYHINWAGVVNLALKGWQERTLYYGAQTTIFFLYLNHLTAHMGIDSDMFESEL